MSYEQSLQAMKEAAAAAGDHRPIDMIHDTMVGFTRDQLLAYMLRRWRLSEILEGLRLQCYSVAVDRGTFGTGDPWERAGNRIAALAGDLATMPNRYRRVGDGEGPMQS